MAGAQPPAWDSAPSELPWRVYVSRATAVYWHAETPACRAKGPRLSVCLLNPDHDGDHYGNGYDEWGPLCADAWPHEGSEWMTTGKPTYPLGGD